MLFQRELSHLTPFLISGTTCQNTKLIDQTKTLYTLSLLLRQQIQFLKVLQLYSHCNLLFSKCLQNFWSSMCIKCIYIPRSMCFIYLGVPLERHSNTWAGLDLWYSPLGIAIYTKEKSVSKRSVSKISNVKQGAKWEFHPCNLKLEHFAFSHHIYIYIGCCSRSTIFGPCAGKGIKIKVPDCLAVQVVSSA